MKNLQLSIVFFVLLCSLSCNKKAQCPNNQTINIGTFEDNWTYLNKDLGIKLKLPQNWYITTYQSKYQNTIPMTEKMVDDLIDKSSITLKEVLDKKNNREALAVFPIFLITSFNPNPTFEEASNEKSSLGFCISNSPNQDEEKDIEEILKNTHKGAQAIEKIELTFGSNQILKCIKTSFSTQGKKITRIIGIKNYGCYNLFISIDYSTEKELENIMKILNPTKE
jgi:hypothetical protein